VTTRPGDETAAGTGGRGHLRASHADRERVVGTLKAAFVAGMLAKDEFDLRVGQALAARTYAELGVLTADIPAGLVPAQAPKPALVQPPPPSVADGKAAARMIATATAIPAALWAFVFFAPNSYTDNGGFFLLITSSTVVWLIVLLLVGVDMHISRQQRRSGGKLPPRPGPRGTGGHPGARHPLARTGTSPGSGHGPRHTAETAQSRHPGPTLAAPRPPLGRRYATG
jgi:Domain of unknown function (DUF1707)